MSQNSISKVRSIFKFYMTTIISTNLKSLKIITEAYKDTYMVN